jgi:hypothetical protein
MMPQLKDDTTLAERMMRDQIIMWLKARDLYAWNRVTKKLRGPERLDRLNEIADHALAVAHHDYLMIVPPPTFVKPQGDTGIC